MTDETVVIPVPEEDYNDMEERVREEMEGQGYDSQPFFEYLNNENVEFDDWEDYTDQFTDSYHGEFGSKQEFAMDLGDQLDLLGVMAENLRVYFDWAKWGRDLFMGGDYWESNGYYFKSN